MKKIIFVLSLVAAVAVVPSVYAVVAKANAVEVLKGDDKKKKKKEKCEAKCEKGKKSCCSGASKESKEATPAQ